MAKEAQDLNLDADDSTKRERSTVSFPYGSMEDAIEVAKAIFDNGGQQGTMDQVAAWLKHQTVGSGAFRVKLYSARIFGLVKLDLDRVTLTPLANKIVHPHQETAARAEAFLAVPLYRKIYEKYKGKMLPGDTGLESEMGELGVASKQRPRARQGFQRSAETAGLFAQGKDRLVLPGGVSLDSTTPNGGASRKMEQPNVTPIMPGELNPLLVSLIEELPASGEWPSREEKDFWTRLFLKVVDKLYKVKE